MAIRNTTREARENPLATLLGTGGPGGIERQEAAGQTELVESPELPVTCNLTDDQLTELGFELEPKEKGEIFRKAKFPDGWKVKATDRAMCSDLLDDQGRRRAGIFYKAAFYDRKADIRFCSRYSSGQDFDGPELTYTVRDCDTVLASKRIEIPNFDTDSEGWREANRLADKELRAWAHSYFEDNGIVDELNPILHW